MGTVPAKRLSIKLRGYLILCSQQLCSRSCSFNVDGTTCGHYHKTGVEPKQESAWQPTRAIFWITTQRSVAVDRILAVNQFGRWPADPRLSR